MLRSFVLSSLTLLVGAGVLLYFKFSAPADLPSAAQRLDASPVKIRGCDFGTAWSQSAFRHRVVLTNEGDDPLAVKDVSGSCECTVARAATGSVPPHGEIPIELKLDLQGALKSGRFKSDLTARLVKPDGKELTVTFLVEGDVEPCPIQIGRLEKEEVIAIEGVPDTWGGDVRLAAATSYNLSAEPDGKVVGQAAIEGDLSGQGVQLYYSIDRNLPHGIHDGIVQLIFDHSSDAPRLLFVPVRVRVVPDLISTPSAVAWGGHPVGEELREFITLRSRSGKAISRVAVKDSPDYFSSKVSQGLGSQSDLVEIRAIVPSRGNYSGSFRLELELENEMVPQSLEIPFTFHGYAPSPKDVSSGK